jgi:hypothetical protein
MVVVLAHLLVSKIRSLPTGTGLSVALVDWLIMPDVLSCLNTFFSQALFYCRYMFDAQCLHTICCNVGHADSENHARVISGFQRGVNEIFVFLKYFAAYSGSSR